MDLLGAWVLFPLTLAALCAGAGLLVDRAAGARLALSLVLPAGFAAIVVVGSFLTLADATAPLTTPVVVVLALGGFALGLRSPRPALEPLALVGAAVVLCVYAAPIVASGEPTIAGFIKLDDTATWLALTDRIMDQGRDLGGLAPSTYEATLSFNLGDGYPVGAFVPFGIASELNPLDRAWLIQPYMASGAGLLALGLWQLARPLAATPRVRVLAVVIAAQPALLFGYYLWGGVKEVLAAALIASTVALAAWAIERPQARRLLLLPAVGAAALLNVLSAGGFVWLAVPLLGAAVILARSIGVAAALRRSIATVGAIAIGALPLLLSGSLVPPTSSPLTDGGARGNLIAPLKGLQAAGIWPAGDFRLIPDDETVAYLLIAVALAAAVVGVVAAVRARQPWPVLYVAGSLAGCVLLVVVGSPWVGAKALATASPAIPFAALLGTGALLAAGLRAVAAAAGAVVIGGVLWSNALGYGAVSLAPRAQLAELEHIGELVAGEGPSLMTEYEPYGVRHFLRESDGEGVSELRRHVIPLTDGTTAPKGDAADTDSIDPTALGFYRTLVVRRSPAASRPPAAYDLLWRGAYYEAWQRDSDAIPTPSRLALGSVVDPYAIPDCDRVVALANGGKDLVAAEGQPPIVIPLDRALYPRQWSTPATRDHPVPHGRGTMAVDVRVARAGTYEVWLGGSVRPQATLHVDGDPAGELGGELLNRGGYMALGEVELDPGVHTVEVRLGGADLHPGSAGDAGPLGPLALTTTTAATSRLVRVPAARAEELCGRPWDWIEVVG